MNKEKTGAQIAEMLKESNRIDYAPILKDALLQQAYGYFHLTTSKNVGIFRQFVVPRYYYIIVKSNSEGTPNLQAILNNIRIDYTPNPRPERLSTQSSYVNIIRTNVNLKSVNESILVKEWGGGRRKTKSRSSKKRRSTRRRN